MRLMLLSFLAALTAAENQTAGIPFQVRASAPGTPIDNRMMTDAHQQQVQPSIKRPLRLVLAWRNAETYKRSK